MSESSVLPSHGSYLLPQFEHATVVAVNSETRRPVGILSTLDIAGVLAWGEM